MVQITVDSDRCDSPRECRRCLEACPESVFMVYPRVHREPNRAAEDWIIAPVLSSLCSECWICVDACPTFAITLSAAS